MSPSSLSTYCYVPCFGTPSFHGEEKVRSTAKGVAITSIQQAMQVVHQFIQYSSYHDSLAVVTGHI
jgi:hypothetical protein